jgi:putative acetyltransferase
MQIRRAAAADLPDVLRIHAQAFGQDNEGELVRDILADPGAQPTLSLLAVDDDRPLGHILFSKVRLSGADGDGSFAILAPLAVVPEAQGRGLGGKLVEAGLARLAGSGVELVFVLGDPAYYARHGFTPAGPRGLAAPYPIAAEHADAWMVKDLRPVVLGKARGKVVCADALNRPELWRE